MKCFAQIDSPVGNLLLVADDRALLEIHFEDDAGSSRRADDAQENPTHRILKSAARQLHEYFAKKRKDFDVPLSPAGTPFQQSVWNALLSIPYGKTCSYGEIARRIKNPRAARAVGLANGANPIPLIIPCHRVIGANGTLTGYGGGLDRKRSLLDLENSERSNPLLELSPF